MRRSCSASSASRRSSWYRVSGLLGPGALWAALASSTSSSSLSSSNSAPSPYQVAMKLNDAACTLSEHGDYENSIELLREAMLAASTVIDPATPSLGVISSTVDASYGADAMTFRANLLLGSLEARGFTSTCATTSTLCQCHHPATSVGGTSNETKSREDDDSCYGSIHNKPTLLPVYHADMSPQAHVYHVRLERSSSSNSNARPNPYIFNDPSKLSAVLMYNLALIYRKSGSIAQAAELNSMAASAAQTGCATDNGGASAETSFCPSEMVCLYALNNLAECNHQQGKRDEAARALSQAETCVSNMLQQSQQPASPWGKSATAHHLANMLVKIRSNLGLLYYQAGEMSSCLRLLNDVLCVNKCYDEGGNFSTVQILYNIGIVMESLSSSLQATAISSADYEAQSDLMHQARDMFQSAHDIVLRLVGNCTDGDVCKWYGNYAPRIAVLVINKLALKADDNNDGCGDGRDANASMLPRHKSLEQKLDFSFRHGLDGAELAAEIVAVGAAYSDRDDHDEALAFYAEGLRLELAVLGENNPNVLITLNNIGQSLHCKGEYAAALTYYTKALGIRSSLRGHVDHLPVVPTLMHNIALIYMHTGRQSEALPYFQSSLKLQRAAEALDGNTCDDDVLASSLYNIGVILADRGSLNEALNALVESVSIRRSTLESNQIDVAEALIRIAQILQAKGKHKKALSVLQGVLDLALPSDEDDCREIIVSTLCSMAQVCYTLANLEEGLRHYCLALDLLKASASSSDRDVCTRARLVSILGAIAGIYSEKGEVAQAQAYLIERTRIQRVGYGTVSDGACGSYMPAPAA
mmetsp:Transcript_10258/g.21725  ORF Transcript_10258/g.21725 Transcript_10258/m.21725 type:complete len:815 (+) Transcript_10258:176-2620(+)